MATKKISTQNIITGVVIALALILVVIVILVKTGAFDRDEKTTREETVIESSMVLVSETQDDGNIIYYTMVSRYSRPKSSSIHTYPTTKPIPQSTEEIVYIEETSVVHLSDENGNPLYDENGQPVTQVISYTIPANSTTTTEPTTQYVPRTSSVVVTNVFGRPQKDENGNDITELVTLDPPPTTKPDIWSVSIVQSDSESENDSRPIGDIGRDDNLAQAIVEQLNEDRAKQGLEAVSHATRLKASARTASMALALPDVYGENNVGDAYTFTTTYGGQGLYQKVINASRDKAMSADTKEIGVGVVKYKDNYYTTVIYG